MMLNADNTSSQIEEDSDYSAKETAQFLMIKEQTVLKYLREGVLKGVKRGPKKKWYVSGKVILRKLEEWNMI